MNSKEEILKNQKHGFNAGQWDSAINAMEEYASLKMGELIDRMEIAEKKLKRERDNFGVNTESWLKANSLMICYKACIKQAQSLISGDTAGEKKPCDNYISSTGTCNNCGAKVEDHIQEWAGEKEPE